MFSLLHLTSLYVKLCFITSYNINVYSRDMYIGCIQSRRLVSCILRRNLCNSSCDWVSERWQGSQGGGREVAGKWQTPTQMRDCKHKQTQIQKNTNNRRGGREGGREVREDDREVADIDSDEGLQTQTNTNTHKHKQSQMRDDCKPTQIPILHTLVNIVCSGRSSLWKGCVTMGRHRPFFDQTRPDHGTRLWRFVKAYCSLLQSVAVISQL